MVFHMGTKWERKMAHGGYISQKTASKGISR